MSPQTLILLNKYNSTRYIVHSQYSKASGNYDVALVEVEHKANFTTDWAVQPICLPDCFQSDVCNVKDQLSFIAGWGATVADGTLPPDQLKKAWVHVVDSQMCTLQFFDLTGANAKTITDQMICARAVGADFCDFDEGAPLMVNNNGYYAVCGIASYTSQCGDDGRPSIYTNICDAYAWINQITGLGSGLQTDPYTL